jgi:hypothetical protein
MAERRTKVYQGRQEQERDEADAVAHGWRVVSRDSGREGYRVVYELDSPYASRQQPTRGPRVRRITWVFVFWTLAFLAVILVRISTGGYPSVGSMIQSPVISGLALAWLVGAIFLGLLWFRGRR